MADKSLFGPELSKAEINALVNNATPRNIMEFFCFSTWAGWI